VATPGVRRAESPAARVAPVARAVPAGLTGPAALVARAAPEAPEALVALAASVLARADQGVPGPAAPGRAAAPASVALRRSTGRAAAASPASVRALPIAPVLPRGVPDRPGRPRLTGRAARLVPPGPSALRARAAAIGRISTRVRRAGRPGSARHRHTHPARAAWRRRPGLPRRRRR